MIRIQNVSGKAILMCLNSDFGRAYYMYGGIICSKTPFRVLAPINKVKEVLIHIRLKYCSALPRMCLVWKIAQCRILRHIIWVCAIFKCFLFGLLCINAYTTFPQLRTLNFRQAMPLDTKSLPYAYEWTVYPAFACEDGSLEQTLLAKM